MTYQYFKNLHNIFDFFLRKNFKFSRKYRGSNQSKENLFSNLPAEKVSFAEQKEQEYFKKYHLEYLKNNSTKRIYLENLAIIELLESSLSGQINKDNIKILDIGSKNWFYAYGEYSFLNYANFKKNISLYGLEIDAYRVYSDFHSRYDYAQYYIENLSNARYIVNNLLNLTGTYNFITWFFPFVTEFPLLEWGLPKSEFNPEKMILHAYSLLDNNGFMLIVNQDQNEYNIQKEMLVKLNIPFKQAGIFNNSFIEYEHDRFITIIHKL